MSFYGGMDRSRPLRPEPLERVGGPHEKQRTTRSWVVATGTLACPSCDAPVAPAPEPLAPAERLSCPVCDHAAWVRTSSHSHRHPDPRASRSASSWPNRDLGATD